MLLSISRHLEARVAAQGDAAFVGALGAGFVARDLGEAADEDMARRFELCLTYDRGLAVEAARALLARIAPTA
jgi:hypothetical protein